MKLFSIIAAIAIISISTPSEARARHRHHAAPVAQMSPDCNILWPCIGAEPLFTQRVATPTAVYSPRSERRRAQQVVAYQTVSYSGGGLVDRARAYMGTNPTGWRRVWCGRFMAMIAPNAAARIRNPNMAKDWANAGPHYSGCTVGSVAVLGRRGGGHVGVVSACTAAGPQIVSGNHGHRVGEGIYPAGRVIAYVGAT